MSKIIGREIGLNRMVAATDARCFVSCGVPIAMIGAVGDGSHSVDEYQTISTTNDSLPKGDVAREFGAVDERVGLALVAFAEHPRDCGLRSFRSEVLHLAERRLAVFLPPFPVFFFRVKKLSYIGKTLAKPRAREGQRPRCPHNGESGSGDAAPPGVEANHGQQGRCPRFAAVPLVLTDALHASDLLPQNENSLRNDSLASDETVNQ